MARGQLQRRLRPTDDVFAAAETALKDESHRDGRESIRRQAWRCVDHLFPLEWKCVFADRLDDDRWDKLVELGEMLGIAWSDDAGQYVASKKAELPGPPISWLPTYATWER